MDNYLSQLLNGVSPAGWIGCNLQVLHLGHVWYIVCNNYYTVIRISITRNKKSFNVIMLRV